MAVQIPHVRFSGYNKSEETIIAYRWLNPSDGMTGGSDKPTMVDFIDNKNGEAHVGTARRRLAWVSFIGAQGQPYLRTYADGQWNTPAGRESDRVYTRTGSSITGTSASSRPA